MPAPRIPAEVPHGGPTYGYVPPPVRPGGPQSPGWLSDEGAAQPSGGAPGRIPPGGGPEMMDTLSKVITGFAAIGLLGFLPHWATPTLRASKLQQRGGTWGWLQSVLDNIQSFLAHGTNYIGHHVSKGAAHVAASPAHALDLFSLRWEQSVWNLAWLASDIEFVIGRLVHHVIPHQINAQTVPLRARVRRLRRGLVILTSDLNALRHWIRHELNHNVKPRIGRVETKVNHTLPSRIRRGEKVQARQAIRQKADHHWIVKLLPLLTVAGATGLVLKAFTQLKLKGLLCQNVKDFFNSLCPSPPGSGRGLGKFGGAFGRLLGDLAALSFIPFALTEACQLVHAIEALAIKVQPEIDALVLGIEGFVCGGTADLPSAIVASDLKRATPLPTGL